MRSFCFSSLVVTWLGLSACASPGAPEKPRVASPLTAAAVAPVQASKPTLVDLGATRAPVTKAAPAPQHLLDLTFSRELDVPVTSIALGEGERVAVLSDPPRVRAKLGFKALPLPPALQARPGERDFTAIYFGRDNEPRIMGKRLADGRESPIYWRHTATGWHDGREEIGALGSSSSGGLFGVLGGLDPELVCRANAQCIIKRNSGWVTAPAGATERRVLLVQGTLWGLDTNGVSTIDAHGWTTAIAAPPGLVPGAFWAMRGEAWVTSEDTLFHYVSRAWQHAPPPIAAPAAFWADRADSVWLVGEGGAAHFDGREWQRCSLPGPLSTVRGRADGELWFGGKSGLFRVAAASRAATAAPSPQAPR